MNILIAMDSFKGSMSSAELAHSIKSIIEAINPIHHIKMVPIADGGEGTVEALTSLKDSKLVELSVTNPLFKPIKAQYAIVEDTAIIEMASAAGLTLLKPHERNPLYTTTFGLGEMIKDALKKQIKHFIIGLGGSATNDAGIGFLSALGYKFLDKDNTPLKPIGLNLQHIVKIDDSNAIKIPDDVHFQLACDVNNPFSGLNGAAHIYAPQKGASNEDVLTLDQGLIHYAKLIKESYNIDLNTINSTGAAGGLAAGFIPFFNTTIDLGVNLVFKLLNIENHIKDSDLIITGEGKIDHQTLMDKAPYGIIELAKQYQKKLLVIGGTVSSEAEILREEINLTLVALHKKDTIIKDYHLEKSYTINTLKKTINQVDYLFK